jgi:hypothetical protein
MSKSKKHPKEVHNKKEKNNDIVVKLDKYNVGRIPTAKGTIVINGKKYNNKKDRKKSKINLKKYIG